MTRFEVWVPISGETDAAAKARREREAARVLRARAVERAGGEPCPRCGGADPLSGVDDVCRCGVTDHATALQARCLRNLRNAGDAS